MNTYGYVGGNPLRNSDFMGLEITGWWIVSPLVSDITINYPHSFSLENNRIRIVIPTAGEIFYKIGCKRSAKCRKDDETWEVGGSQNFVYDVNIDQPIKYNPSVCSLIPNPWLRRQCHLARLLSKVAGNIERLANLHYDELVQVLAKALDPTNVCIATDPL